MLPKFFSAALVVALILCAPCQRLRGQPQLFQGAPAAPAAAKASPLSADEELNTFTVPAGFQIELVAADPEINKVVAINFDEAGRMWAVTATEYPLDGNEHREQAIELYKRGGKDRVLIFDAPTASGRQTPRTFADHLAMPMSVLPFGDGAIIGHGPDILFLHDRDHDGKADERELLLTGFGIDDSHLMPHLFTRGPGDWIYMGQGAFNYSKVKTKSGAIVQFDQTKEARFKPDGSVFEIVAWGPNNIWGFVIDRRGEMFLQEANDLGYPVVPFFIGSSYPGIGMHKPQPYAPWQPPLANFEMGGTGLSGLALAEDEDGFPAPYRDVMYVANPITGKIQAIKIHPDGPRYRLEKLPDFINSSDPWFRPVAMQFGPDGCLYIVDWYNKIISHNEVPRNHPERDKFRSRIWRVRHVSMPVRNIPDLTRVSDKDLLAHLRAACTWEGRAAQRQIIDRHATGLSSSLRKISESTKNPVDLRLRALWALEGLHSVKVGTLGHLTKDTSRAIRREAMRVLATQGFSTKDILTTVQPLVEDSDPQVRAEVIRTLASLPAATTAQLGLLVRMGKAQIDGAIVKPQQGGDPTFIGNAADRAFERSLVRAALEKQPRELAEFLDSKAGSAMPLENRLLAFLALEPAQGASRIAREVPQMQRTLSAEELGLLLKFTSQPIVEKVVSDLLQNPKTQVGVLHALLALPADAASTNLNPRIAAAVQASFAREATDANRDMAIKLAATFRVRELKPILVDVLTRTNQTADCQIAALKALRETGVGDLELFQRIAMSNRAGEPLQREAAAALAQAKSERALTLLIEIWPVLSAPARKAAVDQLASSALTGHALLRAIKNGDVAKEEVDAYTLEKLETLLAGDPDVSTLKKELAARPQNASVTPDMKAKFELIRSNVSKAGNVENGKQIFTATCMPCHNVHGLGGQIGPTLNGAGAMESESLLRSVVTPSAAVESGYYRFRVETTDADLLEGLLVSQNEKEIVLRQPGAQDLRILRTHVKRASFSRLSIMPEGLLDAFTPEQQADLFSYLRTLK